MKIQFDIKFRPQIESGEYKVETRDGKPVRIICWDKKSEKKYGYNIVGLVEFDPQHEESTYYTTDGKGRLKDKEPELLIVTPEPELSEFEKAVYKVANYISPSFSPKEFKEQVKVFATELLDLAKRELCESGEVTDWYAKGKAEALKDLPRWKSFRRNSQDYPFFSNCEDGENCLVFDGKYIKMCELLKLPGFKED